MSTCIKELIFVLLLELRSVSCQKQEVTNYWTFCTPLGHSWYQKSISWKTRVRTFLIVDFWRFSFKALILDSGGIFCCSYSAGGLNIEEDKDQPTTPPIASDTGWNILLSICETICFLVVQCGVADLFLRKELLTGFQIKMVLWNSGL